MKRFIACGGSFIFSVLLLTGCSQVEDILNKVSLLLDEQIENEDVTNESNHLNDEFMQDNHHLDDEENTNQLANNDEVADSAQNNDVNEEEVEASTTEGVQEDTEPFDERLQSQGYDLLTRPNGFDINVPYHWILVEQPPEGDYKFCYDVPLTIDEMSNYFLSFDDVEHDANPSDDNYHKIFFEVNNEYENWNGEIAFFMDEYDNTCATVTTDWMEFEGGEDPSTMVSDEELAERQEAESTEHDADRERFLEEGFAEWYEEIKSGDIVIEEYNDVESIQGKLMAGDLEMFHIDNGYPVAFPYEWYLVDLDNQQDSSGWSGTYCTDATLYQTVVKHLDMLEQLHADIYAYDWISGAKMNRKSTIEFAFNDIYGTGSWEGSSTIYIDRTQNFQTHQCIDVDMMFSPEQL